MAGVNILYNKHMANISVFIISKNEGHIIEACLKSVHNFADEIILVDDSSTDDTIAIAQKYGAKIYQRKMESFTKQKQYALDQCTKKWALNLDCDETLTEPLKQEIIQAIKQTDKTLFYIPLNNIFLGRAMAHSGLAGQKKERLALRQKAHYAGGRVHEALKTDGPSGTLKNHFNHTPYRDITHYFTKFNNYTTLGAQSLYERGKKFNPLYLLRQPVDFIKIYIFRLACLDGAQGFLWALFSSFYPTIKYAKLWNLHRTKGNNS